MLYTVGIEQKGTIQFITSTALSFEQAFIIHRENPGSEMYKVHCMDANEVCDPLLKILDVGEA